jgi:SNF2 family DNA or RNA helicase
MDSSSSQQDTPDGSSSSSSSSSVTVTGRNPAKKPRRTVSSVSDYEEDMFNSLIMSSKSGTRKDANDRGPKYPVLGDSLVLYYPNESEKYSPGEGKENGYVPVVVHPKLVTGRQNKTDEKLTDKQVKGLRFLWKKFHDGQGCILAHEMGLGKVRPSLNLLLACMSEINLDSYKVSTVL